MRRTVRYEILKNMHDKSEFIKPQIIDNRLKKLNFDIDTISNIIIEENKKWSGDSKCKNSCNFQVCGSGINAVSCDKYLDRPKIKINNKDEFLVLFNENENLKKLSNNGFNLNCSNLLYKALEKVAFSSDLYVNNIIKNSKVKVFENNKLTMGDVVAYLHLGAFKQDEEVLISNKEHKLVLSVNGEEFIFEVTEDSVGKILEYSNENITIFVRINPIYQEYTQPQKNIISDVNYSSEHYVDFILRANDELKSLEFSESGEQDSLIYSKTSKDFKLRCKTSAKPLSVIFEKVNNTTIRAKCNTGEELSNEIQLNRTLIEKGVLKFTYDNGDYVEIEFPMLHGSVEILSDIKEYLKDFSNKEFVKKFNGYECKSQNTYGKYCEHNEQSFIFIEDNGTSNYVLNIVDDKVKITLGNIVKEFTLTNDCIGKLNKFVFNNKNMYIDLRNIYIFTLIPKSRAKKRK